MKPLTPILIGLVALASCGGTPKKKVSSSVVEPTLYTYEVVAAYPHSVTSYTQGLELVDGVLWEGTGEYGRSRILRTDLTTGRILEERKISDDEFGEGITLLGDKLYQLTWLNGKLHIYDKESLRHLATHSYKGEGWGLTNDGERLYMSDGTNVIRVLNGETLKEERRFGVKLRGRSLGYINELEWIDERIWANIYTTDQIAIINPENGAVEGLVDMQGILPDSERTTTTDVLNGIAYDKAAKRIFVTGKNWSKLFEIKIFKQ